MPAASRYSRLCRADYRQQCRNRAVSFTTHLAKHMSEANVDVIAVGILACQSDGSVDLRHVQCCRGSNCGSVRGNRIASRGLACRPRTEDMHDAPAIAIIHAFLDAGAITYAQYPKALPNGRVSGPSTPTACGRSWPIRCWLIHETFAGGRRPTSRASAMSASGGRP